MLSKSIIVKLMHRGNVAICKQTETAGEFLNKKSVKTQTAI